MIARLVATALATALAAWLIPGITLTGSSDTDKIFTLIGVAIIIGLVNVFVKPVVTLVSGCLVLLTLGLFLLVINALMLLLSSWIAGKLSLGFHVDGFLAALLGSIVISVVSGVLYAVLNRGGDRDRLDR
ncbi:phage holin family protein [Cumulibacter manganitolerans]|uniref:phage holin family protein n=1 Tax=Cumulibacter manganitolerans TaxID=1884992 RepID=UPI0012960CB4|nr:phage holin family protein [Cumulibacter manganitolerans]